MNIRRFAPPMLLLAALAGCAHGASGPKGLAEAVTKAVYDNDVSHVTQDFNPLIRPQLTRASVGALSDKMHAQGSYQSLEQVQSDAASHVYGYTAKFSNGTMLVCMKLDAEGKIAAYRVVSLGGSGQPVPSTSDPCGMVR